MYGCFITPPDPDKDRSGVGAFGMVFFHKDGFSTACGHGTIAGVTWALDTGLVDSVEPATDVWVDVPSGRLRVEADVADGRVRAVRFENVPSWVTATDVTVRVGDRDLVVDVSYGGAFYASADVVYTQIERLGLAHLFDKQPASSAAAQLRRGAGGHEPRKYLIDRVAVEARCACGPRLRAIARHRLSRHRTTAVATS